MSPPWPLAGAQHTCTGDLADKQPPTQRLAHASRYKQKTNPGHGLESPCMPAPSPPPSSCARARPHDKFATRLQQVETTTSLRRAGDRATSSKTDLRLDCGRTGPRQACGVRATGQECGARQPESDGGPNSMQRQCPTLHFTSRSVQMDRRGPYMDLRCLCPTLHFTSQRRSDGQGGD